MILNCPACSAKFMVSAEALGPNGRDVRCGKCSHTWFQPAQHDSLDELQKLVEKIDSDSGDHQTPIPDDVGEAHKPEIKLNASPKDILNKKTVTPNKKISKKASGKLMQSALAFFTETLFKIETQKIIAGFAAAVAVVMLFAFIILTIARPFYAPAILQIMIDTVKVETGADGLNGSFRLVNLSSETQSLPPFKLLLLTESGRIVSTKTVESAELKIEGEAVATIKFHFDDAPSVATKIKIISE